MKIFRQNNYLQIIYSDGNAFTSNDCTDEMWEFISGHFTDECAIRKRFRTEFKAEGDSIKERVKNSDFLILKGASVYMKDVSELSIPEDFVEKILEAEENEDYAELNKYRNFWTLVSMNPDPRVRNNIFWFIRQWDMKITDSGLIVAYRNAVLKHNVYSPDEIKSIINAYYTEKYINHKNPYDIELDGYKMSLGQLYDSVVNPDDCECTEFTDAHSRTTTIRLGQPVSIPRSDCDPCQDNVCSKGLHTASKGWLKNNYFGDVGLQVLVNPAYVVAIPPLDSYGKMRCCEYLPVAIVDFDENGDVIEPEIDLYTDIKYLENINYNGDMNNVDVDNYTLSNCFKSREDMYESILERLRGEQED